MDEQRCELPEPPIPKSKSTEDMLDMVERVQGDRMDEQRSDLPDDEDPPVISKLRIGVLRGRSRDEHSDRINTQGF